MADWNKAHEKLLKRYPRPIVHMRKQFALERFGLIFGAGLNKSFGLPDWANLVAKIAADPAVQGENILKRFSERASLPYKTELLFQHFRKQQIAKETSEPHTLTFENKTYAKWLQLCADHLYKEANPNFEEALNSHPYLLRYLPIIQHTQMTVTYNFDDNIEKALAANRGGNDKTRGYEMVTNPWAQFKRRKGVIYHPNGIVPTKLMELPVDKFVFSESSFAKQFLGALAGELSGLLNHLSKNTCLILGSSLEDEMFRNLLVQSAQANPGNAHYYCYFLNKDESINDVDISAITKANFSVYNLITLFLNEEEIATLADLVNPGIIDDNNFSDCAAVCKVPIKYCFYLTGPLGVGKSTTINQLRNLSVLDEWVEQRLQILGKPWEDLTPNEKDEADNWILNQFALKNEALRHEKVGIFIIDRPPLDPLVFEKPEGRPAKAKKILEAICKGGAWETTGGTIILLTGPCDDLAARVLVTGRGGYTADKLRKMENSLKLVYESKHLCEVATNGMSIQDVTKRVAEIVHFEDYNPCNLHEMLNNIKDGSDKYETKA
jgi:hypothetical protein